MANAQGTHLEFHVGAYPGNLQWRVPWFFSRVPFREATHLLAAARVASQLQPLQLGVFPRPYVLSSLPHRDVAMRIVERRSVITAGLFASMALLPPAAWSLPALPAGSPADRLSRMLQSAAGPVRVKPQVLPRSKLENDFAVLLMRTTYSVADQLDYYPMDKFQQDQFLFRQDEWELYREALPGVQREW